MQKRKPKQAGKKDSTVYVDPFARNAFRLLKHAAKLCGDELTGDLHHLPITRRYAENTGIKELDIMNDHQEVVYYGVELLMAVGFSLGGALNVVSSAKATKDVMQDMYTKV